MEDNSPEKIALDNQIKDTKIKIDSVVTDARSKYSPDIMSKYGNNPVETGNIVSQYSKENRASIGAPKVDPWTQAATTVDKRNQLSSYSKIKESELYANLSDGSRIAKYESMPSWATSASQIEEYEAQKQSTGEKWAYGVEKFMGKTLSSVAGVTIGSVYGALEAIKEGSFKSIYDNDFSKYTEDLNTKMDYKLPNYYTQQEKDYGVLKSATTANFWANDVLGGASFTVGAIVGEGIWAWATGGASLSTTAARYGSKLANLGKFGRLTKEALATSVAMNKAMPVIKNPINIAYSTARLEKDLAIGLGKAGELTNTARFMYTSSAFEAGQEARAFMSDTRKSFMESFSEKNNRPPTEDEYRDFNKNLTDSGNALFAFNMGILAPSNMLMMGKIMGIKSPIKTPDKWANKMFFGLGSKRTATGELENIAANRLQKVLAKSYTIVGSPIREGGEEGLQSVGQNTAKSWIEATYDPRQTRDTIDLGLHFTNALSHTLTSKEGQKEMFIGAIIGFASGTGISLASGKGLFGNLKDARESAEKEVEVRNNYTAEKTLSRIHTANRVAYFDKQAQVADEKGDVTGSELSRSSSMIAHITNAYNFDSIEEAKKEFSIAVGTMDSEVLKKQYGFETEEQVRDFKKTLIEEHSALAKEYTKNREYVDYMISSSPTELKGTNNIEDIKEAVAFELTLGYKAHEFSGELLSDLQSSIAKNFNTTGQAMSDALQVQDILWASGRETRRNFLATQKELKNLSAKKIELEKQRLSLEKSKNNKEDNKADLNKLNSVMIDIEATEKASQVLETKLEGILSAAQLQNPYNTNSELYITGKQLENVESDLNYISKLIEDFKNVNPREAYRLEGTLKEYAKSKTAFTRYATLASQLTDPKLGLRGKRNIISELASKKATNEPTIDFLKSMGERYDEIKEQEILEQTEASEEVRKAIAESKKTMKPGVETKKVNTVTDIIKDNPYLMSYVGTADNAKVPTKEEIEEYKKYVAKIKRSKVIDNEKATRNAANYYAKKGIKTSMSAKEMARFQELNQKMSDWRFYEAALNEEGISMADLIEQEISRNKEAVPEVISDELVVDDYVLVMTPSEVIPTKTGEEFRKSAIVQTYENVKVQIIDGVFNFSHLKVESILSKLKGDIKMVMRTPKTYDDNGFVTSWNKPVVVGLEDIRLNQDNYGTIFNLVSPTNDTQITVANRGRIQIPVNSFNNIKEELGFDIFKPMATKTTYSDLYEDDGTGKLRQKESDFKIEQELGADSIAYEPEEVFNLEPGTNTFFKLNIKDSYNQGLKDKYEAGEIELNEVINQVKVYNTAENGKILGDVKSNQEIVDETENFLEIRRMAADILLNKDSKQNLVTIPMTAKAKFIMLGVPDITMVKTEDGVVPESRPLTEKALEQVVDYGFMVGGQLVLKSDTKGVRMDFVSKLSKKENIPVVIFKQGSYLVAFPVSLVKRDTNKAADIESVLKTGRMNKAQKATIINGILTENGITPDLYYNTVEDQNLYNEDGSISPKLTSYIEELSKRKETADVREWADKNHDKNTLIEDITLTIDLENKVLRSPKAVIDFNNAVNNEVGTPWYDNYISTGDISQEQVNIIANRAVEAGLNTSIQSNFLSAMGKILDKIKSVKSSLSSLVAEYDNKPKKLNILTTPSSEIVTSLNKLKTFQDKLTWLKSNNLIQPVDINGKLHNLIDYNGRVMVLVRIGNKNIPFYISTGQAGKKSVKSGEWYPVFGIGEEGGWINKGNEEQINNYYNQPILQKFATILNSGVGNIESREDNGNGKLKGGIGFLEEEKSAISSFNKQMNLNTKPAGRNSQVKTFYEHLTVSINSINDELRALNISDDTTALRDKIEALKAEEKSLASQRDSLQINPAKASPKIEDTLSPQEKDVYTKEKARIMMAMDNIVRQTKPAGNLGCK